MSHPPRRFGLRIRLLALVLAPALLLTLVGVAIVVRERRAADQLSQIQADVEVLSDLTNLRSELLEARAPVEIGIRAQALGIDKAQALKILGLEDFTSTDLRPARKLLDRLPPDVRPFPTVRLDRLGQAADADSDGAAIDQFDQLDSLTRDMWEWRISLLEGDVTEIGSASLRHRLDDLQAGTEAGSAAGVMVTKLADYWFSFLGDRTRTEPDRADLAIASSQFDRSMADLQASTDSAVLAQATGLVAKFPRTRFARAVDDAIQGKTPQPFADGTDHPDIELMSKTFSGSFDLFGPLYDLIAARSDKLQDTATALAEAANQTAAITIAGILIVIVAMVGVSVAVAATFERPLSRLIEANRLVGEGELRLEPLATDGPAEIGEASAAFNDVVANLLLLEGKVEALASGDLEDPRLRAQLPGELGEAMDHSIGLLSASIAERQQLEERLAFQATHDALTALPNRLGALEALDGAMARAQRSGSRLALAFLDLDGFKQVNDAYGHQAGDEVLQEVARRLDDQARAGDFCARLGGDEFVIIAEDVADERGALTMGRRVAQAIGEPIHLGSTTITVGASIGVAFRSDGEGSMQLLARADQAAYQAKRTRTIVQIDDGAPAA